MKSVRRMAAKRAEPLTGQPAAPVAPQRRATGHPLPDGVRSRMEAAFRADFSDVRVLAGGAAREVGAVALTRGAQISVDPGAADPHSAEGMEVLGHELAHVLQQRDGRVPGSGGLTDDRALEAEADEAGRRAAGGEPVGIGSTAESAGAPATAAVAQPMWPFGRKQQPSPPENYRQTMFQGIPSRAMVEFQQGESPYQNIPTIAQLQEIYENPYQNIPQFPPPLPTAPKPPVLPRPGPRKKA